MRRLAPVTSALIGLLLGCEPGASSDGSPLPAPEWAGAEMPERPPATPLGARADVGSTPVRALPDPGTPTPHIPLVDRTVSLKERFETGQRLHRELRVERSYRVRVHAGRTASVQGTTELTRAYTVDVHDALGGQIVAATVTIETDGIRLVPGASEWPRMVPSGGGLEGVRYTCRLNPQATFDCDLPLRDGRPIDVEGVAPQRPGTHPGRPAAVGATWDLHGAEAQAFLGSRDADVSVALTFDDNEAAWLDGICHHISYSFTGTQPLTLSGRTLTAELSGRGELYHCLEPNAIVYHRQERDLTATQPNQRPEGASPLERVEHIVIEERTTVEQTRPVLAPLEGPP